MSMNYKLILDGALFSECFYAGKNRYGMLRVAEEISNVLINENNIELAFANTIYLLKYNNGLNNYLKQLESSKVLKNISNPPSSFSKLLEWKSLYFRLQNFLPLNVSIKNVNDYDIFHSFYYPIPNSIQNKKIKKSITFLDIIPLKMNGYSRSMVQRTMNIVNDVKHNYSFAISEYSKTDILNYDSSIDPNKIFVAPLAASKELFYQNSNKTDWEIVQKKYDLPSNYFLAISSNDKRKNIPHLIKSFNKFILQNKVNDIQLLLVGNYKFSNLDLDELGIDKLVQSKIIIPNNFIDNKDLAIIYSNAVCFFFMSLYEGFGLPALEAMQCGIPIVASNTSSIPEVVGNAGIMLSPEDEDGLANEMGSVYYNSELRNEMAAKSLSQSQKFSWELCAKIYNDSFAKMLKA
jgi:glycosyltransferase involved in cell wall biosynthesis